jgi:hypothetical protein
VFGFQDACTQPLSDQAQDPAIPDTVLDDSHQLVVVDGIKVSTNVCIEHPVHLHPSDSIGQCVQGPVGPFLRPESIGEAQEVFLVDRTEYLRHCPLDHFVLYGSDPQRPEPAVGFRNVSASRGLRSVCAPVQLVMQFREALLQAVSILPPCLSVYTRAGRRINPMVCLVQLFYVDMV